MIVRFDAADCLGHDLRRADAAMPVVGNLIGAPHRERLRSKIALDVAAAGEAGDAEEWRQRLALAERGGHRSNAACNLTLDALFAHRIEMERVALTVRADDVARVVDAANGLGIGGGHLTD